MNENKTNINWYPGHMAKTKRQIKEIINLIDIVYEIVDARIPFSSKLKDIDEFAFNKSKILVMTKKDLCNMNETTKWINYYKNLGYKVLCLDLKDNNDYKKLVTLTREVTASIQEKRLAKGLNPKEIKALVVGIPNAGKSTLINKMVGRKVAVVENKPGITKKLNFLPTGMGITLLDTPGILWPKLDNQDAALNMASVGSIKKEILNMYDVAENIINVYMQYYPDVINSKYGVSGDSALEIIENLSKKWGFSRGGEADYTKTSERIYNDLINGKVSNITLDICK